MRACLIIPENTNEGNLIWMPPYLYPQDDLDNAIDYLKERDYIIEYIQDGSGLAFRTSYTFDEIQIHFDAAFPWINISFYQDENDIDPAILRYCLVVLPVSRLEIHQSILTKSMCLFPAGEFIVQAMNLQELGNTAPGVGNIRDHINGVTKVSDDVFTSLPVIVFNRELSLAEYKSMSQQDDVQLIKDCSNYSERLMDLIRYYRGDYNVPEFLPAKAGIWSDRYSGMIAYFSAANIGYMQAREVELKTFIKGIGMDISDTEIISNHPLLSTELNQLQNIVKHALKLNTAILESDNETMKFAQIMMLLEYIGDPNNYGSFKELKKKIIPCLTSDLARYEEISERFKQLTGGEGKDNPGLRTQIVHNGKDIEKLIPLESERKELFSELHGYIYLLIRNMMFSNATTWEEYDRDRLELRKLIFPD